MTIFKTKKAVKMKIQNNNYQTNFGQLYINSTAAQKLLKKADKAVKAQNAIYVNTNIPKGHSRPLWSVLSKHIEQRQKNNPNNIIIDIANKAKQILSVKSVDKQGFLIKSYEVNPIPDFGTHNDIFPKDDWYRRYYHSFDQKLYSRSNLFDVLEKAEYDVDSLLEKQLKETPDKKISIRELEKPLKKISNNTPKAKKTNYHKKRLFLHVQKPFENLKELIENSSDKFNLAPINKKIKTEQKNKSRLPRKIKKELSRN